MTKKHKVIIAVFVSAFFAFVLSISILVFARSQTAMLFHICNKYGWKKDEVTVIEYEKEHFEHDFGFLFLDASNEIWHVNSKWLCEYKGREFNVEYTNLSFADDYQLEDIFVWCTEYMQENVDPEIVGVEVYSDIIYHSSENDYNYDLPWSCDKIFKKDDIEAFLQLQAKYCNNPYVFYKVQNIELYGRSLKTYENLLIGNELYEDFAKTKNELLKKNEHTKNANIVLISNNSFSINSYNFGSRFQNSFSLDKNEKYYVLSMFSR